MLAIRTSGSTGGKLEGRPGRDRRCAAGRELSPFFLFETTLPVRYYLPPDDVRIELMQSQPRSVCPYKGVVTWWSGQIGNHVAEDIAWSYPSPIPENPRIAGLICFRNEWVDLTVDGERLDRPVTPWT
jgi:uncharacterized protein (DUF427 family)